SCGYSPPAAAAATLVRTRSGRRLASKKKVHRAGGAFIHRPRWLSDWALRPSPYDLRKRLRLTRAPYSVQAATYGTGKDLARAPRVGYQQRAETSFRRPPRQLQCEHGRRVPSRENWLFSFLLRAFR